MMFALPGRGKKFYFVNGASGNDASAGTWDAPFKTIQKGADVALPGDTVNVRGNQTYANGGAFMHTSGNPAWYLTIQGHPGDARPIITTDGTSFQIFGL